MESKHTIGYEVQCAYPEDCGQGGCGSDCGPNVGATDLEAAGAISGFRTFSDKLISTCLPRCEEVNFDFGLGYNWLASAWPFVLDRCGGPWYVVLPPRKVLRFCLSQDGCAICSPGGCEDCPGDPVGDGPSGDQLRYRLFYEEDDFILKEDSGGTWKFVGFCGASAAPGRFKSYESAGYSAQVEDYTSFGHIKKIQFAGCGATGCYQYEYQVFADGVERLVTAVHYRADKDGQEQPVRRALYTYTGGSAGSSGSSGSSAASGSSSSSGSSGAPETGGDLETVTLQDYLDGQWVTIGTYYYRYEILANGAHRIKHVVEPEAYQRLVDDPGVIVPFTASDEKVAEYATKSFRYDANGDLIEEVAGGVTTTFSYAEGTASDGYNNWKRRTVETQASGSQVVTFTNFNGDTLLREVKESPTAQESAIDYYQYDAKGNLTLHSTPAAVESYGYTTSGLNIMLKSSEGLIHVYDYYAETTTGSGGVGVKGFRQYDKIKKGSGGTEIKVRKYEYTQREVPAGSSSSSSSSGLAGSSSSSSTCGSACQEFAVYPLAREIVYKNEDGTGEIVASYSYGWHPGTVQMQERVTTLPAVPEEQNGSGISATRTERFDTCGRPIWIVEPLGHIAYNEYDPVTGNVLKTIQDVDDTKLAVPEGWTTPAGGGLHVVTEYEYDIRGRQTQALRPEHVVDIGGTAINVRTATWTVYKDADRETWTAQGYALVSGSSSSSSSSSGSDGNYVLVNPVEIQKRNATGTRSESIQAVRASTTGKLSASDSFPQSSYVRWSVSLFDNQGRLTASRFYHDIPSSGDGEKSTHYAETTYGYDSLGRQNMFKTPGGTITRTVLDALGRQVAVYVGTDDSGANDCDPTGQSPCASSSSSSSSSSSGANNMVLVTEYEYAGAGGCSGCGGGGSGQLTATVQHVDASTTRVTQYLYDWRNRQQYVISEVDDQNRVTFSRSHYDNLDRVIRAERYHDVAGDGVDPDSEPNPDDVLIARSETFHDDRGQVYMMKTYAVDPTTGAVGNALSGYTWYDAAGKVIKEQTQGTKLFTKTTYDGLGRVVERFVGYDLSEAVPTGSSSSSSSGASLYDQVTTLTGDTILEQSKTDYDAAGNVLLMTTYRRMHNATGTGRLNAPDGDQPRARVSYVAAWYDPIGRQVAAANYGTNGGSTLTRPSTVPARSDNVLVTSTGYDDAGMAYQTINPMGREDRQVFDDAGRVTKTIQNYQDGVVDGDHPDEDVTVETTYNADGQVSTLTAKNPTTGDQTTRYVYGTTLANSGVARADLLRAVIYPDSDDTTNPLEEGQDGVYDRVEYKYNRQGERTEQKDQNGTVHAYQFDGLGRLIEDQVSVLGTGIDGAVRRIATRYEVRGMVERITSYDSVPGSSSSSSSSGAGIVNEVQFAYNAFRQLTTDCQEHAGAVSTSTLVKVQHSYADGSDGHNRLTKLTYPNGRGLLYGYSGTGDAANRTSYVADESGSAAGVHLAEYSYLGLGNIV